MTTLIAWISYSRTGERPDLPNAVYFASDSRITWGSNLRRWDAGRKLFSSFEEPHLFGYCGDVVFPSLVLSQAVSAIDRKILFEEGASCDEKHQRVYELIKTSFRRRHNAPNEDFWTLHACREKSWPDTSFSVWKVTYKAANDSWSSEKIPIPSQTSLLASLGSGANVVKVHKRAWEASDVEGTSRAVFSAFCDAISSEVDHLTGGMPQIAALYANLPPRTFGFVQDGKHYLDGLEFPPGKALSRIEWRDRLFQRVDPHTLKPEDGARRFARPRQTQKTRECPK